MDESRRVIRAIGRRIAELRREHGWTQEALAERAGISVQYLGRIETGRENFTVSSLVWIGALLGVKPAELFAEPASTVVKVGRPRKSAMRVAESEANPVAGAKRRGTRR